MEHSGLGIDADNAVIWIAAWSVAAMAWSVIAVVRGAVNWRRAVRCFEYSNERCGNFLPMRQFVAGKRLRR